MSIRLRKDEREQIVAALEAEYDSAEGAALSVFQLCFDLLAKRSLVGVFVNWGEGGVVLGPFPSQVEAKSAAKRAAATFNSEAPEGAVRIIPLVSPASLSESPTGLPGGTSGCECGHVWPAHIDQRWKRWRRGVKDWAAQPWLAPGCMHCTCKETWTQPKRSAA